VFKIPTNNGALAQTKFNFGLKPIGKWDYQVRSLQATAIHPCNPHTLSTALRSARGPGMAGFISLYLMAYLI